MSEETGLDSWFLHEKLVLSLLPQGRAMVLTDRIPGPERPFAQPMRVELFERALATYLACNDVASLVVEHLQGRLKQGQLVWLKQDIAFKGVGVALKAVERGGSGRASFSTRLATDTTVRVSGTYSVARLTCGTAAWQLSGVKQQFVLGYVQIISADEIELRPIVIARRWLRPMPEIHCHPADPAHVWPSTVDQFAGVDFKQRPTKADLNVLKDIPEAVVKSSFADIFGEPDVPKDWGGEQCDLWTRRLSVKGQPLRAAFVFKGPAKFGPMTISTLGKNGDQIYRLAQMAADLMVVQHCHSIAPPVVHMLQTYARDPRNPRRYMTLDGYDTVSILRHFGKIE